MRSAVFYSLAVSTLALFAQASPEPCSDHPGVIHAPGEYTVPEVLKLTQPDTEKKAPKANHQSKAASSSSKSSSSSSNKSASSSNKAATKPSKSIKSAQSWNKPGKAVKKQPTPKVKAANKETVAKGADDAVSSFTNSSYIPADQADKLKEGE